MGRFWLGLASGCFPVCRVQRLGSLGGHTYLSGLLFLAGILAPVLEEKSGLWLKFGHYLHMVLLGKIPLFCLNLGAHLNKPKRLWTEWVYILVLNFCTFQT